MSILNSPPGFHRCPRRGCAEQVPNARYACLPDWQALSLPVRQEIVRTRRMHVLHPERRAAFRMAEQDWEGKI